MIHTKQARTAHRIAQPTHHTTHTKRIQAQTQMTSLVGGNRNIDKDESPNPETSASSLNSPQADLGLTCVPKASTIKRPAPPKDSLSLAKPVAEPAIAWPDSSKDDTSQDSWQNNTWSGDDGKNKDWSGGKWDKTDGDHDSNGFHRDQSYRKSRWRTEGGVETTRAEQRKQNAHATDNYKHDGTKASGHQTRTTAAQSKKMPKRKSN